MEEIGVLNGAAWYTVGVILTLVVGLVRDWARPDLLMLGALGLLLVGGVVSPREAFAGFANPAVITVGALYVVAAGVQQTNALARLDRLLFSRSDGLGYMLARFMIPTAFLSGLLNNTPIVAMLTPRLQQWASERGIPASKLMIPLSYAAIVGGMTTLVGTSTNLIVSGLMVAEGFEPLGLFDVTWIGLPAVVGVIGYFALIGHRLLPDRGTSGPVVEEDLQEGLFEVKVTVQSPFIGQTIAEAGLRDLSNAYLTHVRRGNTITQATPRVVLEQGDILEFTGDTEALQRLLQRAGLKHNLAIAQNGTGRDNSQEQLPHYEAIVADSSDLVGKTLREANFREEYQGVVLGIQRKDKPVFGPIGNTPIRAGDLLIIEAPSDFEKRWSGSRDEFYLVALRDTDLRDGEAMSEQERRDATRDEQSKTRRAPLALTLTGLMVVVAASGYVPIVTAAFVAAMLMVVTGCITGAQAQRALNIQVLAVIAAALGVGQAVQATGLADVLGHGIVRLAADAGPIAILASLYVATNLLTEIITNNAAAVLMLPIALAVAGSIGAPPIAFGLVVAVAASASFITPIGYQTNLMVMGPGGYRFSDYARAGWPVSLLVMAVAISVIALLWL